MVLLLDSAWLLVFDNVENAEDLSQAWPTVGCGRILITCRSKLLAESQSIATAIEIPPFSVAEGKDMILHILDRKHVSEEDLQAISEISKRLGGLALALDVVAKNIKFSCWFKSISEFLPYLDKNERSVLRRPRDGTDPYYSKDVENVWQRAFDDLSDDAADLLRLLCFMGPESIPQSLLQLDLGTACVDKTGLLANLDRSALPYFIFILTCGTQFDAKQAGRCQN